MTQANPKIAGNEADSEPHLETRADWLRSPARKIWRDAYWLLPNFIPHPYKEISQNRETRDRANNEESRIPEDESLRLEAIWGVEVFSPTETEQLFESLRRLGWSAGAQPSGEAVRWIKQQRSYGFTGAWYNVGMVTRRSAPQRFPAQTNFAAIPEGVDYLIVQIFQTTPSLTSIVVGFVLTEASSKAYEAELSKDRKTIIERAYPRGTIAFIDPSALKERAIEKIRSRNCAMVRRWFKANLPGYFSNQPEHRFPTAELITTSKHDILPHKEDRRTGVDLWKRLFVNVSHLDIWTHVENQSFRFSMNESRSTDDLFRLVVGLRTSGVPEEHLKYFGARDRYTYIHYSHEKLAGLLNNVAGLAFLREVSKDLRISRANLKVSSLSSRKSLRVLESIQKFFERSVGTPAVAAELRDRSERPFQYLHQCARFLAPKWSDEHEDRGIAATLFDTTHHMATHILDEERTTREQFDQLSGIVSVRESVRAQRKMEYLTIAAIIVAVGSLILALPAIKDWPKSLQTPINWVDQTIERAITLTRSESSIDSTAHDAQ